MSASAAPALLAGLLLACAATAAAQAPVSHFVPEGIEIDGDQLDEAASAPVDWFPAVEPFRDPIEQDDDTLCGTSPAPKNDLANTFVANDQDHLYVAMERLANRGNTSFFFSFDITGDGPSLGDFIFVFCFGSGATVSDTYVLEWSPTQSRWVRDPTPPSVAFAVNTRRILAPFGAFDRHGRVTTTLEPGQFGEARVRLADIEGFDPCAADDVTLEIQTKSSCSLSSECKDTSGELHFSFAPLTVELEVAQVDGCEPFVTATASAMTPRTGPVTYRWFVDGVEVTGDDPTWATSATIVVPVPDACGTVAVAVEADDGSCTAEDEAEADVNRRPVAAIALASVGPCDLTLAYDAATSTDCNGDPLAHAWDFDGDGVVDSTAASGTHVFASCGDRTITLRVSDGSCESEPVSAQVAVNAAPDAGFTVAPSAAHCLEIAVASTASDCDLASGSVLRTEALTTTTDFGDGSAVVEGEAGVHRYAACGTYVVTQVVTDASGCADVATREVTIEVVAEVH